MKNSRLNRYVCLGVSLVVVCWIVFRVFNPAWTNYCILINGDGTSFGEVQLVFSTTNESSALGDHKIFLGERLGAIAVLPLKGALKDCKLTIRDQSGLEIGVIDFRPPGRFYRTAVVSLGHAKCKIDFGALPSETRSSIVTAGLEEK